MKISDQSNDMLDFLTGSKKQVNAWISWILTGYLFLNCVRILFEGSFTWSLYGFLILLLVFTPSLYFRDFSRLAPFEVIAFLCVPFTLKGLNLGFAISNILNYLTASGVALLVVSELEEFTSFKTTPGFSVLLVSVTSLGVAGLWAVTRWLSDIYLGTGFLVSEQALMWEFTSSLAAGLIAGTVFKSYMKRKSRRVEDK